VKPFEMLVALVDLSHDIGDPELAKAAQKQFGRIPGGAAGGRPKDVPEPVAVALIANARAQFKSSEAIALLDDAMKRTRCKARNK